MFLEQGVHGRALAGVVDICFGLMEVFAWICMCGCGASVNAAEGSMSAAVIMLLTALL